MPLRRIDAKHYTANSIQPKANGRVRRRSGESASGADSIHPVQRGPLTGAHRPCARWAVEAIDAPAYDPQPTSCAQGARIHQSHPFLASRMADEQIALRYRKPDTPRWGRTSFRDQETSLCSQSVRGPRALERPVNHLCLSKCGELWSCAKIPRYSWTHRAPPQPPTASADRSIAVDSWDAGRPYGLETDNRCASCRTQLSIFQAPLQ